MTAWDVAANLFCIIGMLAILVCGGVAVFEVERRARSADRLREMRAAHTDPHNPATN